MVQVTSFLPELKSLLPETYSLLLSANLVVDEKITRVILHGSRGLKGGARPDSDIDLSLIVDIRDLSRPELETCLQNIIETTLSRWRSKIELDLVVVFDIKDCGLICFDQTAWKESLCLHFGEDCFGLYKIRKGYEGLVVKGGVQVKLMYPCLKIWQL